MDNKNFNYNFKLSTVLTLISIFLFSNITFAQEIDETKNDEVEVTLNAVMQEEEAQGFEEVLPKVMTSSEFVTKAWEFSGKGDLEGLSKHAEECLAIYGQQARDQQSQLSGFPERGNENQYETLNNVSTVLFIKAEALMNFGKKDESIALFSAIINDYGWSQAWDARGWFWSVAEKSQDSIDVMMGKFDDEEDVVEKGLQTMPVLFTKGTEEIVDYTKYGKFVNVGTKNYRYKLEDPQGLSEAVGEAIYPNTGAVLNNPGYKKAKKEGRLTGTHWDYIRNDDLEASIYKWATAPEPWGIKLFFIGMMFEKANMYYEAIKAYHAIVVHFPKTIGWTYWKTPWYPAQAAIAKIKHIARVHPELKIKSNWMKIEVKNGYDNDVNNDETITYPGIISKKTLWDIVKEVLKIEKDYKDPGKAVKTVGGGTVQLVQYENKHWQLLVEGKPYIIKGITYAPTKIGQSPDKGTLEQWMDEDTNENGLPDGPYDSWVDKNRNNKRDEDEPIVGDFQLMKEMGVNTIREYHQPKELSKEVFRKMYKEHGIRVILGDFLGKYTLGSGASWFEGTDYENPQHQQKMMESVKKMVMEYKDEPYILLWLLGNENNYGVACNADKKPEAYFKFANEVAKMIKSIDPNHPVALCNGDTLFLDKFAEHAPDIDIFSANAYRGSYGFASFWEQVFDASGKPAFITEYGCPAYAKHLTLTESEKAQADYHIGNWMDIEANSAGMVNGVGNALGGVAFEWADEWWKNYEPFRHDKKSDAIGPFPGGYYFEEWFGLVAQGNGTHSPFLRVLRKSYFAYKEMWNK